MINQTKKTSSLSFAFAAMVLALGGGTLASAQSGSSSEEGGYVCLARSATGPDGAVETTKVKVLAAREQLLAGRGFVRADCIDADKWLRTSGASLCALADVDDPSFVNQFQSTHGLTPSEICTLTSELPNGS